MQLKGNFAVTHSLLAISKHPGTHIQQKHPIKVNYIKTNQMAS